jgi:hypothetical protein
MEVIMRLIALAMWGIEMRSQTSRPENSPISFGIRDRCTVISLL